MKLKSKNGKWYLTDGDKTIIYNSATEAIVYMFLMTMFKPIPYVRSNARPVRSLTPNPKPLTLTLEDKIKISRIKAKMPKLTNLGGV